MSASTRHYVDLSVSVEGDDGIDPEYLMKVLSWGIHQHNLAVEQYGTQDGDQVIELLDMQVSEDFGLGLEKGIIVQQDNEDPVVIGLAEVEVTTFANALTEEDA